MSENLDVRVGKKFSKALVRSTFPKPEDLPVNYKASPLGIYKQKLREYDRLNKRYNRKKYSDQQAIEDNISKRHTELTRLHTFLTQIPYEQSITPLSPHEYNGGQTPYHPDYKPRKQKAQRNNSPQLSPSGEERRKVLQKAAGIAATLTVGGIAADVFSNRNNIQVTIKNPSDEVNKSNTSASELDKKDGDYDTRLQGRNSWFTPELLLKQLDEYDSPFTTDPTLPKPEGRKAFVKAFFEMCLKNGMDPVIIAMTREETQFGTGGGVYGNTGDRNPFNIRPLNADQTRNPDGSSYQLDPVLQDPNGSHTEDNEMAAFPNDFLGCQGAIQGLYVPVYWTGKAPNANGKHLVTLYEIINEHAPKGENNPDAFTKNTSDLIRTWAKGEIAYP